MIAMVALPNIAIVLGILCKVYYYVIPQLVVYARVIAVIVGIPLHVKLYKTDKLVAVINILICLGCCLLLLVVR